MVHLQVPQSNHEFLHWHCWPPLLLSRVEDSVPIALEPNQMIVSETSTRWRKAARKPRQKMQGAVAVSVCGIRSFWYLHTTKTSKSIIIYSSGSKDLSQMLRITYQKRKMRSIVTIIAFKQAPVGACSIHCCRWYSFVSNLNQVSLVTRQQVLSHNSSGMRNKAAESLKHIFHTSTSKNQNQNIISSHVFLQFWAYNFLIIFVPQVSQQIKLN